MGARATSDIYRAAQGTTPVSSLLPATSSFSSSFPDQPEKDLGFSPMVIFYDIGAEKKI